MTNLTAQRSNRARPRLTRHPCHSRSSVTIDSLQANGRESVQSRRFPGENVAVGKRIQVGESNVTNETDNATVETVIAVVRSD